MSVIEDELEYNMDLDEEEEETGETPISLSKVTEYLESIRVASGWEYPKLRMEIIEKTAFKIAQKEGNNIEQLLLSTDTSETTYNSFLKKVYPHLAGEDVSRLFQPQKKDVLLNILSRTVLHCLWEQLDVFVKQKGLSVAQVAQLLQQVGVRPVYVDNLTGVEIMAVGEATSSIAEEDIEVLLNLAMGLQSGGTETTSDTQEEEQEEETPETSEPIQEELEDELEDEEEEEDDPEVVANTARVMMVYKDLFEVGFELKVPFGILTKEGSLRLNRGKTRRKANVSLNTLYKVVNEATNGYLVQSELGEETLASKLRNVDIRKGTTYYPEFQLGNLFGMLGDKKVDSWEELRQNLEPEVYSNIKHNLEAGKDIGEIVDALTTCMVISEFDPKSALKLRINVGNKLLSVDAFKRNYEKSKTSIFAGIGELFHMDILPTGVVEIILVFNKVSFNGRPLFAYEAIESLQSRGRKPSIREMVLGQDTSGKTLTINLDNQQASIVLIGAGQRSGKGVLTLNILGTILSGGNPMIYLDGKPDMAEVLWKIGYKYGVNPAVWDLFERNGHTIGSGAPERIKVENPGVFGVIMYLKTLQLMLIAASLQAKGEKFLDGKRPFFIFDEALATQMTMSDTWKELVKTAKDKNAPPEEKEWCAKVVEWSEKLDASLGSVINSQLPKSGVSTLWLFQTVQPTSWNQYKIKSVNGETNILKNPIMSRLSLKLMGRGTADSEYGLSNVRDNKIIENRVLSEGGRHFAMSGNQKIASMDSVKVFKPYLVLNESENGAPSVEALRGSVSKEVWSSIAPTGSLHEGAGFEGFAKMLGEDAIQNLSKGREYLDALLTRIGERDKYGSIDEYLYDCSIESFQSVGSLVNGADTESEDGGEYIPNYMRDILQQQQQEEFVPPVTPTMDMLDEEADFMPTENEESFDPFGEGIPDEPIYQPREPDAVTPSGIPIHDWNSPLNTESTLPDGTVDTTNLPVSERMNYDNVYNDKIDLAINPFTQKGKHGVTSMINAFNRMSEILLNEIRKVFGDLSRVRSLEVTGNGLVINDIAFRPQFDKEVIDTFPYDIRGKVSRGDIVELFHFRNLTRFRNLEVLRIDNARLAEGRVRREIPLSPKKSWFALFNKMRSLNELYIAGEKIVDDTTAEQYEDNGRGGFSLTEKLREKFQMRQSAVSDSPLEKVWNSRPVKVVGNAVGWTIGVKTVTVAASLFGGWGLLFGAFAGYGAYKELKKRRGN